MNALRDAGRASIRDLVWGLVRFVALAALAVLAILAIPGLDTVRARLDGASAAWVGAAAALEVGSALAFGVALHAAFGRRLRRRLACALGLIAQGVNALAPAGGTTGVAVAALIARRTGVSGPFVAARAVGLFILTSIAANVLLIVVGGLGVAAGVLPGRISLLGSLLPALGAGAVIVLLAALGRALPGDVGPRRWRRGLSWALVPMREGMTWATQAARIREPLLVVGALGYVLFDFAALIAAFHAVGNAGPAAGTMLLAYALGQAGSVVSLPGAAAGGMVGLFALYHVPLATATAAVLIYQLVSSLVPLALGAVGVAGVAKWAPPSHR